MACTNLDVIVAGRDRARTEAFAATRNRGHQRRRVTAVTLDATTVVAGDLRATGAFALVNAAGPWQGRDLRLPRAAIAARMHYIDLADARSFVADFPTLDAEARAAGVIALTGASSTPALSNVVLDFLVHGWRQVDSVEVAISPGNRAPRGLSLVRAILSYAGRSVRVLENGVWRFRSGWGMTARCRIPGLETRWVALCDTPDLDIIANRHRVRQTVLFRAGLELPILHFGLLAASLPVRAGFLRSLEPFSSAFLAVADLFRSFGSDRGGMKVEARGIDRDGHPVRAAWSLVAAAGDGPSVPILPALAALKGLAEGRLTRPGASACVGILTLAEIEEGFAGLRLSTSSETERGPESLFAAAIGPAFGVLPAAVRALHAPGWAMKWSGEARVDRARFFLGRLAAAIFGLPPPSETVPVQVEIVARRGRERWTRSFGGRRFHSVIGPTRKLGAIAERFGPFILEFRLSATERALAWDVQGWRLGPLPLPRPLAPISKASESVDDRGRFTFDVDLTLPLGLGRISRYRGWLAPDATAAASPH